MAAIVPNEGERAALDILSLPDHEMKVWIFSNDITPDDDSVFTDFVIPDYQYSSSLDLTGSPVAVTSGSGRAKRSFTNLTFTRVGTHSPETIYGWIITLKVVTEDLFVFMAKRFTTPIVLTNAGDKVSFDLDIFATEVAS